jgi:hypothetical protein
VLILKNPHTGVVLSMLSSLKRESMKNAVLKLLVCVVQRDTFMLGYQELESITEQKFSIAEDWH